MFVMSRGRQLRQQITICKEESQLRRRARDDRERRWKYGEMLGPRASNERWRLTCARVFLLLVNNTHMLQYIFTSVIYLSRHHPEHELAFA